MPHLSSELRLALRHWFARPSLAAMAILVLALGLGATTAIFSVVDAVLLRRLPWQEPDRLAAIFVVRPHWRGTAALAGSWDRGNISWPILVDLQTKSRVFSDVASWSNAQPLLGGERVEPIYALSTSASFLQTLGLTVQRGRFFTPEEDTTATESVVVSHESWQRRFGGADDVIGRAVTLDGLPRRIVGVLPPRFNFTLSNPPEFILPWGNLTHGYRSAGNHFMYAVARLKPGVTLDEARLDSDPLVRGEEKPEEKTVRLTPLADEQLGPSRRPLWMMLGAAGLLLLIACANVAGLLVGDAAARRHEMAVRAALGGSRWRLARQLFVEHAALGLAAAAAGLVLAAWLTPALVALAPSRLPRIDDVAMDARVFAFAALVSLVTSLLFGIGPALALAASNLSRALREGGRNQGLGRLRAQGAIVAVEVALSVVLIAGASLMSETVFRLTAEPLGFNPDRLVVASLRVPLGTTVKPDLRLARTQALLDRLAALPGVTAAAATSTAPFSGGYGTSSIQIDGKAFDQDPSANRHIVTDTYFDALGIPILKGRGFDMSDTPGDHVAVVTPAFERQFMDGDAIGKTFTLNKDRHLVVGVAGATKHREYSDATAPSFYALNRQLPQWFTGQYIVRTSAAPASTVAMVRQVIESAEPSGSLIQVEPMDAMLRRSVAEERYRALLSALFGATALLLAAVGIYSVVARSVADRRREIGVRMALGALPGAVRVMVLRQGLGLVLLGLAAGIPAALATSQMVASLLYGVAPQAPHIFVMVALAIAGVATAATLLPAARAARVDPAQVLRSE